MSGTDLHMTISAPFPDRRGWAAVGAGSQMAGALMFVMYPGAEPGAVTVSVRTTQGHYEPQPVKNGPRVDVHESFVDAAGYSVAKLTCYSCESWMTSDVDSASSSMSWLWASDYMSMTQSVDAGWHMQKHTANGLFYANMELSSTTDDTPADVEQRVSFDASTERSSEHHGHHHNHAGGFHARASSIHGSLMALSFLVIFPCGIAALRYSRWLMLHWLTQLLAIIGVLTAAVLGVWMVVHDGFSVSNTHIIAGLLCVCLVLAQPISGWLHHTNFVKSGLLGSWARAVHMWSGRGAWLLAMINIVLGLRLSAQPQRIIMSAVLAAACDLAFYCFYLRRKQSPQGQAGERHYRTLPSEEHDCLQPLVDEFKLEAAEDVESQWA